MINDIEKVFDLFEEQFEAEELKSLVRECKKMYIEKERLNNIIKEIRNQLDYLETYSSKEDVFEDMKRRLDRIKNIVNRK